MFVLFGVASIRKDGPALARLLDSATQGSSNMSVTVGEILVAARAGLAALTSETVGYLVLGAADRVSQASPASFEVGDIELDERGMVTVPGIRPAAQDRSEIQLRTALGDLLDHAQSRAPALDRVRRDAERSSGRLIGQIEAALIPVNRAAARRALARLHRDVMRARESGALARATAIIVEPPAPQEAVPVPEPVPVSVPLVHAFEHDAPGTPVIELPPIDLGAVEPAIECCAEEASVDLAIEPCAVKAPAEPIPLGAPECEEWEAAVSELVGAPTYEPEATPFLGAWPVAEVPDHDTDHAPPVVVDEPVTVAPVDRSDVDATTQVLFATAVAATPPIPAAESERPLDDIARIMGPVWTPIVEAEVELVHLAVPEQPPEATETVEAESEDAWIVTLLGAEEQAAVPEPVAEPVPVASIEDALTALEEARTEPPDVDLAEIDVQTVEPACPEPVQSAPHIELPLLVPVENVTSILSPARRAGYVCWMLSRVDPHVAEMSEMLLDGASIASIPAETERGMLDESEQSCPAPLVAESIVAADEAAEVWEEIDVTYDDEPVEDLEADAEPEALHAPEEVPSEFLTAPPSEVLLGWVVRDEALYGDILGVQEEVDDVAVPDDVGEPVVLQEDIGEIDWIRAEEKLSETPCEVPFAKYDPRESYAPEAMSSRWEPLPVLDADAIDAGWEISESSLPPVSVAASADSFATESPPPPPYRPRQSDISELLAGFVVAETRSLREISRELKRIAGVAVTPAPPNVSPLAAGGGGVETSPSCTSRTWPSSRDS